MTFLFQLLVILAGLFFIFMAALGYTIRCPYQATLYLVAGAALAGAGVLL